MGNFLKEKITLKIFERKDYAENKAIFSRVKGK